MKITATGGGGFSGRTEHYELDTGRIEQGAALEALLRDLDFFDAAPPQPAGADIGRWAITVADGARQHTVRFAEDGSAGSAPWQSLVARLRTLA
ncbi:MAG: protealysin inhibitor emfourin [Pseudomonadota bacterium]